jgi:hypothetical protein
MQKQAVAITAKDFGDSSKPGTPAESGEVVGADGKPIPYAVSEAVAKGNGHARHGSLPDRPKQ